MNRDGAWIKIVLFVLGISMLAGITKVLLDPGLGSVDESRRTSHQAGFSMIGPRGWGASILSGRASSSIRFSPDHVTGRPPSLTVSRVVTGDPAPNLADNANAKAGTFQGQPAIIVHRHTTYDAVWEAYFDRGGSSYVIRVLTPIQEDVEHGPLMPFINSFKTERAAVVSPTTDASDAPTPSLPAPSPSPLLPATTPAS